MTSKRISYDNALSRGYRVLPNQRTSASTKLTYGYTGSASRAKVTVAQLMNKHQLQLVVAEVTVSNLIDGN